MSDYKSRLVRFYEKYAPEKVATVDKALKAYAGKEEDMFATLVTKYGPEPKAPPTSSSSKPKAAAPTSGGGVSTDYHDRLVRFYEKYAPEKVATVDKALKAYAGKEEDMFATLVDKYGPEPKAPSSSSSSKPKAAAPTSGGGVSTDYHDRLVRFYEKYAPEKVATVDKALKAYAGKEEDMFATLVTKYGAEPKAPSTSSKQKGPSLPTSPASSFAPASGGGGDYRDRLIRFYEKYAPEKVATVDKALKAYAGKEEDMFATLVEKYGPEPKSKTAQRPTNAPAPAAGGGGGGGDYRDRLIRFYEKYAPEKVATVDKALKAYAGKEEDMFATLVSKYGAEPKAPSLSQKPQSAPSPSPPGGGGDYKSRLLRFYEKYAPEKVATVDKALKAYAGKEEDMFATLVDKYGPEPKAPSTSSSKPKSAPKPLPTSDDDDGDDDSGGGDDYRGRLTRFYGKYAPEKLANVDKALELYSGKEEEMMATLVGKYGPEPTAGGVASAPPASPPQSPKQAATAPPTSGVGGGDFRERLVRFYEKYAPEKVATVDKALKAYAGKEEDMFATLVEKYGPEPKSKTAQRPTNAPAPAAGGGGGGGGDYRDRLIRFYEKYAPEKVATVDKALKAYAGKEEDMFATLVSKYGTEPPAQSLSSSTKEPRNKLVTIVDPDEEEYEHQQQQAPQDNTATGSTPAKNNNTASSPDIFAPSPPVKLEEVDSLEQSLKVELSYANISDEVRDAVGVLPPSKSKLKEGGGGGSSSGFVPPPTQEESWAALPPTEQFLQRLTAFLLKAGRPTGDAEKMLTQYFGAEERMFSALEKKFGMEQCQYPQEVNYVLGITDTPDGSLLPAPTTAADTAPSAPPLQSQQHHHHHHQQMSNNNSMNSNPNNQHLQQHHHNNHHEQHQQRDQNAHNQYHSNQQPTMPSSSIAQPPHSQQSQQPRSTPQQQFDGSSSGLVHPQDSGAAGGSSSGGGGVGLSASNRSATLPPGFQPPPIVEAAPPASPLIPSASTTHVDPTSTNPTTTGAGMMGGSHQAQPPSSSSQPPQPHVGAAAAGGSDDPRRYSTATLPPPAPVPSSSTTNPTTATPTTASGAIPPTMTSAPPAPQQASSIMAGTGSTNNSQPVAVVPSSGGGASASAPSSQPMPTTSSPPLPTNNSSNQQTPQPASASTTTATSTAAVPAAGVNKMAGHATAPSDDEGDDASQMMPPSQPSAGDFTASPSYSSHVGGNGGGNGDYQDQHGSVTSADHGYTNTNEGGGGFSSERRSAKYSRILTQLYQHFAPDRLPQAPELLNAYAGREEELIRASCADFGAPLPPELIPTTLPTDFPPVNDGIGIQTSGKLTLMLRRGDSLLRPPSIMYDRESEHQTPTDVINNSYLYAAHVRVDGRDLFSTSEAVSQSSRDVRVAWPYDTCSFLMLLDGTVSTITLHASCNNTFIGEAKMQLAALPSSGDCVFPLNVRTGETDVFLRSHHRRLGSLGVSWCFVSDAEMAELKETRARIVNVQLRNKTRAAGIEPMGANSPLPNSGMLDRSKMVIMESDPWYQRISAMYCRYLPNRLDEVQDACLEYRGREGALIDTMVVKFGPEPDPKEFRTAVERILFHYNPPEVPKSRLHAEQCVGRELQVLSDMVRKYGPEPGVVYTVPPRQARAPHPLSDPHRIRLTKWLMLRVPRRLSEVDYLLARFSMREKLLFTLLHDALGAEPQDASVAETVRSRHLPSTALRHFYNMRRSPAFLRWVWASEDGARADGVVSKAIGDDSSFSSQYLQYRSRLERFYHHYNPIKVSEVEETLQQWKGRENMLFDALVHKYGAEPAVSAAGRTGFTLQGLNAQHTPSGGGNGGDVHAGDRRQANNKPNTAALLDDSYFHRNVPLTPFSAASIFQGSPGGGGGGGLNTSKDNFNNNNGNGPSGAFSSIQDPAVQERFGLSPNNNNNGGVSPNGGGGGVPTARDLVDALRGGGGSPSKSGGGSGLNSNTYSPTRSGSGLPLAPQATYTMPLYTPSGKVSRPSLRERLYHHYKHSVNPAKANEVDLMMTRFEGREDMLIKLLPEEARNDTLVTAAAAGGKRVSYEDDERSRKTYNGPGGQPSTVVRPW